MANPPSRQRLSYYDEEFELVRDVCSWFYHYCNGYYFTTNNVTITERPTDSKKKGPCCHNNTRSLPPSVVWVTLPTLIINHGCTVIGEVIYAMWSFLTTKVTTRCTNNKKNQKNEQEIIPKWIGLLLVVSMYTSIRIFTNSVLGQTVITILFILNQLYYNHLLFRKEDCGLMDLMCSLVFGNLIGVAKIDKHVQDNVMTSFQPHLIVDEGNRMRLTITDFDIVINDDKHPGTRQWIQVVQNSSTIYKSYNWNKISRYVDKELKNITTNPSSSDGIATTARRRYIIKEEVFSEKEPLWKIANRDDIVKHAKRHFCVAQRYFMTPIDLTMSSSPNHLTKVEVQDGNSSTDAIVEDMEDEHRHGDVGDGDIEMGKRRKPPTVLSKQLGVSTKNASDRSLSMADLVFPSTNLLKSSATPSATTSEDEQSSQSRSYGSRISSSASIDPKNQHSFSTLANVFDVYFGEETHYGTICWRSVIVSRVLEYDTFNKEVCRSIRDELSQDQYRSYYVKDDTADKVESAAPSSVAFPWRKASEQEIWKYFEVAFNEEKTNHQA